MRSFRVLLGGAAAALVAMAVPLAVSAHALPQSAVPREGGTVSQPPPFAEITFGEVPDPQLSSITVIDGSGASVTAGPTTVVPGDPAALEVRLKRVGSGIFTVTWKTVSSVDGHLATGSYSFGVGVSPGSVHAPPPVAAAAPSVPAVLVRLLLFLGLVTVLGAAMLGVFAERAPPLALRRLIAAGALVSLAATLGVVGLQASGAGVSFSTLLTSSLGRSLLDRGVPAAALVVSSALALRGRWVTGSTIAAGTAALVAMGVDAVSSHAGSENPVALNELLQWLHIAAAGIWVGGLVALLVVVLGVPTERKAHVTRRLSTLAGVGLVVVAATGVFRAVIEVQTWANLVSTAFGLLVLLKLALITVLGCLGAFNRFRNVPRLPQRLRRLRRVVSTEVVAGVAALTVAAALVNTAPPAEYAAAAAQSAGRQPASISVSGSDFATTVRVRLTVTSGRPGFNDFSARVTDYDTGATLAADSVVLQFTAPLRPQLGTSTLTLRRQGDGTFSARGGNLAVPGIWEVAVTIQHGQQSAEVHLQVATSETPPLVSVQHFSGGLPTLYTIHLRGQRSAQVYLDPDRPGAGIFHVTFFSAGGASELRVPALTVGMSTSGEPPTILVTRPFDPVGHYVADVTVPAATVRFDLIATLPDGSVLTTYCLIQPGGR